MTGLPLLARLWLREPDAASIVQAGQFGFPTAEPQELAEAFTDLFVLNVFPYGSVFLDDSGELNGPSTELLSAMYANAGFDPPELREVAAPDHLGLCLAFSDQDRRRDPSGGYEWGWMKACCIAVQREPGVHPFYAHLAELTLSRVATAALPRSLSTSSGPFELRDEKDEVTLGRIVRFFLAPARCGMYLSRGRMGYLARQLGVRLPFGSRFEVARSLFSSAGEGSQLKKLLAALDAEADEWASRLEGVWEAQIDATRAVLREMKVLATG